MHLVYLDESGHTGNNLTDAQQPVFVLCAMIVPESDWLPLEDGLQRIVKERLGTHAVGLEVHGTDLRSGRDTFSGRSVADRIGFRDGWLGLAAERKLRIVYRAIEKKRYHRWLVSTFGPGVSISPHVMAFPLVARVVDKYLLSLSDKPLGMFISDESREIIPDVEKSIRLLRGIEGKLRLQRIVEKGFFIESSKSLPLQLCDVIALSLRKMEEIKLGRPAKPFDSAAFPIIRPMIYTGDEALFDVIDWLTAETKKK
jgi:Protein of unknown function (DUF3800)